MKVVIVGGVAGGASAAARLRRLDEEAEIVIIERTGYVSYANCGLPYYIGGTIKGREKLAVQTPESLHARFNIDVRTRQEAVAIDRAAKQVHVRDLVSGEEYDEPYDALILSPGAKAVVPAIEGVDAARLFCVRTVEDTLAISDFIAEHKPARAAVVGGGFIGVEMAENLVDLGLSVSLFQRPAHVLPILDDDMAPFVQNHMRDRGVALHLRADVQAFREDGDSLVVVANGQEQSFDMVVLAIGVAPESDLAREAGLELGLKGAIVVDEHLRTQDRSIYAVGDAVQVRNAVTLADAHIPLAGPANKQGRIAADNIAGRPSVFKGSTGSSVLKVFDLVVAAAGLTLAAARRAGLDADFVLLSPPSHATYYPGSSPVRLKLVFERGTGRVLGAQAISSEGAEKRIDVVATAIRGNMTVHDLAELDLCYAPPYSSAKDPVNMAGFAACNLVDGLVRQASWDEALALPEGAVLLDVRGIEEAKDQGSIPGALHIPLDDLRAHLSGLPRGKTLYVHCQTGLRSYLACRILSQAGFDCVNVAGGWVFYWAIHENTEQLDQGVGPCGI